MFGQNVSFIFFPKLYKICENFHIKARKLRIIVAKQTSLLDVMQISRFNSSVPADNGNVLHDSKIRNQCICSRVLRLISVSDTAKAKSLSIWFELAHLHEASKIKYTIINNFPSRAYNVLHAFWIQFMNSLMNRFKTNELFRPKGNSSKYFKLGPVLPKCGHYLLINWYINHVLSWWYLHCMI